MKTFEQIYVESGTNATLAVGYGSLPGEIRATSKTTDGQGRVISWYSFNYDGDTGTLTIGDHQLNIPGKLVIGLAGTGSQSVLLNGDGTLMLGGTNAGEGNVRLKNRFGTESVVMKAQDATLTLGAKTASGSDVASGKLILNRTDGTQTVVLDGATGNLTLGGGAQDGDLILKNASGASTVYLDGANGNITLGGGTKDGDLTILTGEGKAAITLAGSEAKITVGGAGVNGDIFIKNDNDIETIKITGSNGDIEFLNADVAEEFDVNPTHTAPPGTVMVLEESGRLVPCTEAYDSRVVGIIAGAGRFRPGIVLDRSGGENRRPIALVGKTYCRVDASAGPIRVGDLLTTSPREGHAMRAADRQMAFGAVIGKALEPLAEGVGLIPVVVKPQ